MKTIELQLPMEFDKSFVVFNEKGKFFPCPWHYHQEYELCLVTKSYGRRMVGDHVGRFEAEDLVFMGSMLPHVWVNDPIFLKETSDHEADAIVIHFRDDFLGEGFFDSPEMGKVKNLMKKSMRGIAFKGETRTRVNNIMKEMLDMNGIKRLASLISIFDILSSSDEYELLASPNYSIKPSEDKDPNPLNVVLEYIMEHFDEDIPLADAASMANMGITTFCNFFKDNFRLTFVEYLNSIRIGHACKLLSDNDFLTIAEIAYQCGFNTLANFNRQFRKFKGMTPSEFKNKSELDQVMKSHFERINKNDQKYITN